MLYHTQGLCVYTVIYKYLRQIKQAVKRERFGARCLDAIKQMHQPDFDREHKIKEG